ncbi:hypothetical protein BDV27DRAFT_130299, partial [Aspergillus caelatus]
MLLGRVVGGPIGTELVFGSVSIGLLCWLSSGAGGCVPDGCQPDECSGNTGSGELGILCVLQWVTMSALIIGSGLVFGVGYFFCFSYSWVYAVAGLLHGIGRHL